MKDAEAKHRADEAVLTKKQQQKNQEIASIDTKLERIKSQLAAANEIIEDGNAKFQAALQCKQLDTVRKDLQSAQSKIDIGIDRKRKAEDRILVLNNKKLKLNQKT